MEIREAIEEIKSYAEHSWGGLNEAFELAIMAIEIVDNMQTIESTTKYIQRSINRAQQKVQRLKDKEEHLSKWGYWEMGYFEGRISTLEDLLDEMNEYNTGKETFEGGK